MESYVPPSARYGPTGRALRELGVYDNIKRDSHFPPHFSSQLSLQQHLSGHRGCVNRLAWNEDGSILASGSDDRQIMLWDYPSRVGSARCIKTLHRLNIFGVEFLPGSGSTKIVTAAYDRTVQLHDLGRADSASIPQRSDEPLPASIRQVDYCHTQVFENHSESVKDVAVDASTPHCFWSAAEDGRVHQFDIRARQSDPEAANMLIKAPLTTNGRLVEFKSLDICKSKPWLMAAACRDRYVRVYDRRRLSLRAPTAAAASPALLTLAPLQLCAATGSQDGRAYTTCARFSNQGHRLLATYHHEQAYAFDITGAEKPPEMRYSCCRPHARALEAMAAKDETDGPYACAWHDVPLLSAASRALRSGMNEHLLNSQWHQALTVCNELLRREPWFAPTYVHRAIILLKRGWRGDAAAALRDADTCIALSPGWPKAYETRVRCLKELGQLQTALTELELLMREFPGERHSSTLQPLERKLAELLDTKRKRTQLSSGTLPAASLLDYAPGAPGPAFRRHMQRTQAACRPDPIGTPPSAASPSSEMGASPGHVCPAEPPAVTRQNGERLDALRTNGVASTSGPQASCGAGVLKVASDPELDRFFQSSLAQAAPSLAVPVTELDAPPGKGMRAYVQQTWAEWLSSGRQSFTAGERQSGPGACAAQWEPRSRRAEVAERSAGSAEAGPSGRASELRHTSAGGGVQASGAWAEGGRSVRARVSSDERRRHLGSDALPGEHVGVSGNVELRGSAWADLVSMRPASQHEDAVEDAQGSERPAPASEAASMDTSDGAAAAGCTQPDDMPQGPVIRGGAGFGAFLPPNLDAEPGEQHSRDAGERAQHWSEISDPDAIVGLPAPMLAQELGFADAAALQVAQRSALAALQERADMLQQDELRWRQETAARELAGVPAAPRQMLAEAEAASAARAAGGTSSDPDDNPPGEPAREVAAAGSPLQVPASATEPYGAAAAGEGRGDDPAAAFRVSPPPAADAAQDGTSRPVQSDSAAARGAAPQEAAASGEDELVGAIAQDLFGGMFENDSEDDGQSERDEAELCSYLYGQVPFEQCGTTLQPPRAVSHASSGAELAAALADSMRTSQRYVGHCNMRTDIKEATYVGQGDAVVACGSDHGQVLLFDAESGELLRILWADTEVANCVQCHPRLPVLATSGLEHVVKLWGVDSEDPAKRLGSTEEEIMRLMQRNQNDMERVHAAFPISTETLRHFLADRQLRNFECNPS